MKRTLILAAMLSILLCAFGTAQAITGTDDEVPADSAVMPFLCEVGGGMDTSIAMADVFGHASTTPPSLISWAMFTQQSVFVQDSVVPITTFGVADVSACNLIATSVANPSPLLVTLGGRNYYAGYIEFYAGSFAYQGDGLYPFEGITYYAYLLDATRGFASGFSPLVLEGEGIFNAEWCEFNWLHGDCPAINASDYFPRYLIVNPTLPESWSWWFFVYPYNDTLLPLVNIQRALSGIICDEDEDCFSSVVPIPYEFNIVDVASQVLPAALKPAGQNWAGYGSYLVCEPFDFTTTTCFAYDPLASTESWSYERAQGSSVAASWDVMHKTPRVGEWTDVIP